MKQVRVLNPKNHEVVISTPWMTREEAALYCDVSRSTFDRRANAIPHAGEGRLVRYHKDVLDANMGRILGTGDE